MVVKNFRTVKHAANSSISELLINGKKELAGTWQATDKFANMRMLVLRNYFFTINNIDWCKSCLVTETGCDKEWSDMHFNERVSGNPTNPGEAYKHWPYHKNLDESEFKGEKFSHTYQERFWPKHAGDEPIIRQVQIYPPKYSGYSDHKGLRFKLGDLNDVIEQLIKNPLTRQAYLPIWFPEDTWAANNKERVPCTLNYYFYVEDDKLHCNYTIRSCDAYRHFRNDLYLTLRLQEYISSHTRIIPGSLNFMIYNFHIFENDIYNLQKKENKIRGYGFNKD